MSMVSMINDSYVIILRYIEIFRAYQCLSYHTQKKMGYTVIVIPKCWWKTPELEILIMRIPAGSRKERKRLLNSDHVYIDVPLPFANQTWLGNPLWMGYAVRIFFYRPTTTPFWTLEMVWGGLRQFPHQVSRKKALHFLHLVGGLEHFLFSHILGIIIPID